MGSDCAPQNVSERSLDLFLAVAVSTFNCFHKHIHNCAKNSSRKLNDSKHRLVKTCGLLTWWYYDGVTLLHEILYFDISFWSRKFTCRYWHLYIWTGMNEWALTFLTLTLLLCKTVTCYCCDHAVTTPIIPPLSRLPLSIGTRALVG